MSPPLSAWPDVACGFLREGAADGPAAEICRAVRSRLTAQVDTTRGDHFAGGCEAPCLDEMVGV